MIKAVIFDADGPLYHRAPEVDRQKQSLLAEFGFTGEFQQFEGAYEKLKFKGYTRAETVAEMFRDILRTVGLDVTPEEATQFAKRFDVIQRQVTATRDASSALRQLKSEGYKLCVLSDSFFSAKDKWRWFEQMELAIYLDAVISSYDTRKLKETPEAYQACIDSLEVNVNEAIFVGHEEYEMAGVRAAHILSVAVAPIAPPGIQADYKVDNLSELPGLLRQINGLHF